VELHGALAVWFDKTANCVAMESVSLPTDVLRAICARFFSVRSILKIQLASMSLKRELGPFSYTKALYFDEEFDRVRSVTSFKY
jgi:hypothetical protein